MCHAIYVSFNCLGLQGSSAYSKDSHESCNGVLDNGSCNEEANKSPTLHTHEATSLATSSSAEALILNAPKPLVTSSSNKLSDRPVTIPIFVSHAPTGLTSPKALRSGFGKGNKDKKAYPSFMVDSHRESTVNASFNKDKQKRTSKKQTGNLNRQSSPQLDMYSSSIAERTRSHVSKHSHSTLSNVTKKAERQLSKLEITMKAFKSYQTDVKTPNDDGLQHHEASEKGFLSGNGVKKDTGKRKRPWKQPRSDSKRKQYSNAYQHPGEAGSCGYEILNEPFDQPSQLAVDRTSKNCRSSDKIAQSTEAENKEENDGNLNKSDGEMDKSEVNLDKSDGELDSSYENESEDDLEGDKDRRVFDETKEREKNDTAVEKNDEGKSEGEHKEDGNVDKLDKNEDESMDEEELDKIEGKEGGKDMSKRQVNNKEVGEVEKKFDKEDLKENQCASENMKEKLMDMNESQLEEERSEVENMEENVEEQSKRELEKDKSEVQNKEEKLEEEFGGKNGGELEDKHEVENLGDELKYANEGDIGDKLEDENEGELEANKNKVKTKEDKHEVENVGDELKYANEGDKLEDENEGELEASKNSKEDKHEVDNVGDELKDAIEGELRDKFEDENKGELEANKNQVETKELQEDKNESVLKDNRNGVENKSDGELDSEEDESSNQTPESTINASPGHGMKQGLFMKVRIIVCDPSINCIVLICRINLPMN